MSRKNNDTIGSAWGNLKTYLRLYVEDFKLQSIEKTTLLLSGICVAFVVLMFVLVALFFVSILLAFTLSELTVSVAWGLTLTAVVYLVLGLIVYLLRVPLFVNPISRMLTRLFLDNPNAESDEETNSDDDDDEDYDDEEE